MATAKAKSFKITFRDGTEPITVTAEKFVTDGSGTRLFDANGDTVASFSDGLVAMVVPA